MSPSLLAGIQGIAFDIDDTLTRAGKLEQEAFDALWALRKAGIKLIAVTGRPLGWADVIARQWPIDIAVGENGAGWVSIQNNKLVQAYFDSNHSQQRQQLELIHQKILKNFPNLKLTQDHHARRCDIAYDIGEYIRLPESTINSIRQYAISQGAKVLCSSVHLHIYLSDCDKAKGVLRAAQATLDTDIARSLQHWLFIGDSPNDQACFSYFPNSIGVANVRDHLAQLKPPPSYVTELDRGLGFAELTRALLHAKSL